MFHPLFIKRNMQENIRKYILHSAYKSICNEIDKLVSDECYDQFPCIDLWVGNAMFRFELEVYWEIANYSEFNDECDYDYTGEYDGFKLLSATIFDEEGNEIGISKVIINEFNNKYGRND